MASNPTSNVTGKVRRDLTFRIPAGLAATTTYGIFRPLRPILIKSLTGISEDAGTSPVFTMKLEASAAEDSNKDPGAYSDVTTATSIVANAYRRVTAVPASTTASDIVAGSQLRLVMTRTSGTLGAFIVHVEYEEDLD